MAMKWETDFLSVRPTPVRLHHFWRRASREMLIWPVFSRHAGTNDGYRWNRDGERGATCGNRPTREMWIRRQRGHTFRKSWIAILAREKNRVGSGFPWAAHEMPASHFCRPALVHTFHVARYLLLPPCPRLPSFIHRPAFHLPFAGALIRQLACASLALNLPLRAASRKPDSSAISHVQCRMSPLHSTIGWDSSAFPINFFFFSWSRYQEISTRYKTQPT